jgi:hypothetical protein
MEFHAFCIYVKNGMKNSPDMSVGESVVAIAGRRPLSADDREALGVEAYLIYYPF